MRTDCHRPGAIVPSDYAYLFSYIIPGSDPFERWNTDLAVNAYRTAKASGLNVWGGMGKCGVCGARYRYGDLWKHVPTGDLVNLGHDCATKYKLLADRPEFDAAKASLEARRAAAKECTLRQRAWNHFVDSTPGLREAFEGVIEDAKDADAMILRDLSSKLRQYGSLSPKQIAFALSLGSLRMAPEAPPKATERHVPAPVSDKRVTIRGVLVSKKSYDGPYGTSIKGTIKILTPEGTWLAWGSLPDSILSSNEVGLGVAVGDEVELTAKLEIGREPHFAFFKRPTKASFRRATKAT